jgi:putative transposase
MVFHVINRGVRRMRLFDTDADYLACLATLKEAQTRVPIGFFAYCLMPNHFHLVLGPRSDGQVSAFMHWFTTTHSKRWHAWRETVGTGAVYQGRFKAFPVQTDRHFLTVCRYVERNALRAGLVGRAEEWPWSSLSQRATAGQDVALNEWPVPQPSHWLELVNAAETAADVEQLRLSLRRSVPFGESSWVGDVGQQLQLATTRRRCGRPLKWGTTSEVGLSHFWE